MAETYFLNIPLGDSDVEKLKPGDIVYLTGLVYTSRDMGHLRISNLLKEGKPLPVSFKGGAVFHAGPVAAKRGDKWELSVIGPTTSIRMEPYAQMVGELGVKAIIGKGGMAQESLNSYNKYKQVYLQAPPGCAVKLSAAVKEIKEVHWLDMGMPEALWVLDVEKFGPLIVTMDSNNISVYQQIKDSAYQTLNEMYS